MNPRDAKTVAAALLATLPLLACAQTAARPLPFTKLAADCAPDVHPATLAAVVSTESSWNPYAIGVVVGGQLERQPRSLAEAVATARDLERRGFNFSVGYGQVNRHNLRKYGETYDTVFDPCRNLKAGSAILKDCFQRAKARLGDDQQALRAAFSCYYSGNFTRGFVPDQAGQPSYVQKVVANAAAPPPIPVVPAVVPQSTDASIAVRPVGRPGKTPKPASTAAQWVVFVGSRARGVQAAPAHGGAPDAPAVKVRLLTPGAAAAAPGAQAQPEPDKPRRSAQALPAARPAANSAEQDAPFVQFVH